MPNEATRRSWEEAIRGPFRIREITIRYTVGEELFELRIPDSTKIKSIYLDHEEAERAKESFPDSGDFIRILPTGGDWSQTEGLSDSLQSLEHVGRLAWTVDHTRTALCIHDEDCMWYCMRTG